MGAIRPARLANRRGLIDAQKLSRSGDELSRWSPLYKLCGLHAELGCSEMHDSESIAVMKWPQR